MQPLTADIRRVDELDAGDIDEMYRLYQRYYDACEQSRFRHDLDDKNYVVELRDELGELRGFSTLALIEYSFRQKPQRAVYSGDTIIHHDFWGSQALPLAWSRLVGMLKAEAPALPLYWLLIVKGHRTYRYLTSFARRYYPNWRYATPPETQELIDFLAQRKFGDAYKSDLGIVSFPSSQGHLRSDWAEMSEHVTCKPNVRFFLERNPGFQRGDELVCLTELREDNLRAHVRREFSEALRCG